MSYTELLTAQAEACYHYASAPINFRGTNIFHIQVEWTSPRCGKHTCEFIGEFYKVAIRKLDDIFTI